MSKVMYSGFKGFLSYLIIKCSQNKKICLVEDNKISGLYQRLFRKVFPNQNIEILPAILIKNYIKDLKTGGKDTLEYIHRQMIGISEQEKSNIDYLILLDPDFQLIYNKPKMLKDKYTFYLKKYCIENYLISEEAILLAIQLNLENFQLEDLKALIQFTFWEKETYNDLIELFGYFAFNYIYNFENGQSLVKKSDISMSDVSHFFKAKNYKVDPSKLKEYQKLLDNNLPVSKKQEKIKFIKNFETIIRKNPKNYISGKYLYHSLYNYIRYKCDLKNITKDKRFFRNLIFGALIDNQGEKLFGYIREEGIS